jgi:aerobic-type carbon monoxide dehydrogenase small subunit (CoxS/CutS family)
MTLFDVSMVVNGEDVSAPCEARRTLADFLRHGVELTGTHVGCEQGACGACTVLVDGRSTLSCLMFAVQAEGSKVTTVEALSQDGELSDLQQAFWERLGLQCGFCTPGMLMAATDLLRRVPSPTEAEIREGLTGNVCRCTGYVNIVRAVQETAARRAAGPSQSAALQAQVPAAVPATE